MKNLSSIIKRIAKINILNEGQLDTFYELSKEYFHSSIFKINIDVPQEHRKNISIRPLKKILFVTGVFPDITHGGGLRVYDFIKNLSHNGIIVDLFSAPKPDKYSRGIRQKYERFLGKLHICSPESFNENELNTFIDKGDGYDQIIVVWPWAIDIVNPRVALNSKLIFDFIECTTKRVLLDMCIAPLTKDNVKNFWELYFWELKALQMCHGYLHVAEEDNEFIKQLYDVSLNSFCIPSYLDEKFFKLRKPKKLIKNSICFIGNYDHYPNLDAIKWYIENCHNKVLKSHPNYTFYVIGTGAHKQIQALKEIYANNKSSIVWIGEVPDAANELMKYEICISPLISGAGFRGKVLQYSALEKPTVSTSIGVIGTKLIHRKNILIADSPDEFSAYTASLLSDGQLRSQIGKNAKDLIISEYLWSSNIHKIINELARI